MAFAYTDKLITDLCLKHYLQIIASFTDAGKRAFPGDNSKERILFNTLYLAGLKPFEESALQVDPEIADAIYERVAQLFYVIELICKYQIDKTSLN